MHYTCGALFWHEMKCVPFNKLWPLCTNIACGGGCYCSDHSLDQVVLVVEIVILYNFPVQKAYYLAQRCLQICAWWVLLMTPPPQSWTVHPFINWSFLNFLVQKAYYYHQIVWLLIVWWFVNDTTPAIFWGSTLLRLVNIVITEVRIAEIGFHF